MDSNTRKQELKQEIVEQESYLSKELENLVYQKRRIKQDFQMPKDIKKRIESVVDNLKFRIIQVLHELSDIRISLHQKDLQEIQDIQVDLNEQFQSTVEQIKRLKKIIKEEDLPRYTATTIAQEQRKLQTNQEKHHHKEFQEDLERVTYKNKTQESKHPVQVEEPSSKEQNLSKKSKKKLNQEQKKQQELNFLEEFQEVKSYILQMKDRANEHKHQDYGNTFKSYTEVEIEVLHKENQSIKQEHQDLHGSNSQIWEQVKQLQSRVETLEKENEKLVDILSKLVKQKVQA